MSKIFISYRRDDAQGEAGHLMAELCQRYGNANVFMDISTIAPGADFPQTIERAVMDSEIVLVLIGKGWLDVRNDRGQRRLDDAGDWVRLEIEIALAHKRRLIPVLVQGSTMPPEEELPVSMRPMARLNAHEISARRWDFDVQALMSALDPLLPDATPSGRAATSKAHTISRYKLWVGGGFLVALLVAGGLALRGERQSFRSYERSPGYLEFMRASEQVSSLPAPGDLEMRTFERARQAACIGLDIACERATLLKVKSTWETICQRRLGRASPSAVGPQYFVFLFRSDVLEQTEQPTVDTAPPADAAWNECLYGLSIAMVMEREERTTSESRAKGTK